MSEKIIRLAEEMCGHLGAVSYPEGRKKVCAYIHIDSQMWI